MSDLLDLSVNDFLQELSSDSPAPGGGSVSAFAVAMAASLAEMVANLTLGRKKYAEVSAEMMELQALAANYALTAKDLVVLDSEAYRQVMQAYQLPKETAAEKNARRAAILAATRNAIEVPKQTASLAYEVMKLVQVALAKGNRNTASDGLVASYLALAGCKGAIANIRINLTGLKEAGEAAEYDLFCQDLLLNMEALALQAEILAKPTLG
ncbi:MAG: cyclodeaminase/cyclohydrolase family protein [Negativicutes bacterium]|nr:cyclodeaminase/cyclohydrolase family protein [Negativicutes bacterium]